jgi:serine protease Do
MRLHEKVLVLIPVLLVALAAGCEPSSARLDPAARRARLEAIRLTAAADVFRECKDSVVNIGLKRQDPANPALTRLEFGSGIVLHEAGYILTNAHAFRHGGTLGVGFHQGREYVGRLVALDEQRDLAVIKIDPEQPVKPLRLGRSADLVVGEQVVTLGNPYGMGMTVTYGIVSAIGRATKSDYSFYPDMIQTSASINPGSSGGPLLNVFGECVGINTTEKMGANNIGFAIPSDRIRAELPEVLSPQGRYGFILGLSVAADGLARVTEVAKGSPAEAAGVRVGDLVIRAGQTSVASALDLSLALMPFRAGQTLPLLILREGRSIDLTVTLAKDEPRAPEAVDAVVPGLVCDVYEGAWKSLPDFASLKPAATEKVQTFDLGKHKGRHLFGLKFTGYLQVPAEGAYTFYAASDDGSRLYIGDRLVVDNDGMHSMWEKYGFIPLKVGKHAITVTYFEHAGEHDLKVSWEGPGIKKQPIPASALFSRGPDK